MRKTIGPYSQQRVEDTLQQHLQAIESILANRNEVDLESLHALVESGNILEGILVHRRLVDREIRSKAKRRNPRPHRKR